MAEEAYQQAIYMTTSDEPQNMVLMVARAIMAERERCARIADALSAVTSPNYPLSEKVGAALENIANGRAKHIAAAIRKGTP